MLDAAIQNFFHFLPARVGDDAAIAEGPRAPFGTLLKPAENFSIGVNLRRVAHEVGLRELGHGITVARKGAGIDRVTHLVARIARTPVRVIHHERARLSENLIPHVERRPHGEAAITGSGMNVDLLKPGGVKNFSVGDAIESHAAGETHRLHACSFGELAQHPEINFFEARLQRGSEITVALLERLIRTAYRSEVASHFGREQFSKSGGLVGFGPAHFRSGAMMGEVVEAETETVGARLFVKADDIAKSFKIIGLTVGAKAHHFVFIAEFQEAEILRDSAVKKSQR